MDAGDVSWLASRCDTLRWVRECDRAVVRAWRTGERQHDVLMLRARRTSSGRLLGLGPTIKLVDSPAADEGPVVARGASVGFISFPIIEHALPTVHVVDVDGVDAPEGWPRIKRVQRALANWQQTDSVRGIVDTQYAVKFSADFILRNGHDGIVLSSRFGDVTLGQGALPPWVTESPATPVLPGDLVTWAVDRARATPWIGDEKIQAAKAVFFRTKDRASRMLGGKHSDQELADAIHEEIGSEVETPADGTAKSESGGATMVHGGFPPPPVPVTVEPGLAGEGKWTDRAGPTFLRRNEGAGAPIVTTFLRIDRDREDNRMHIALWDPREVELRMIAGRVEPKSATGEAGTGQIPRKPEVMGRLLGAFNAGFQAAHGEFGMMAEGTVYLPAKPFAATVMLLPDGSTGFGTWPEDEGQAAEAEVVSFRQNLTPLIQDGKPNPYGRTWWGGTPDGWKDDTFTARTGICLTKEGFVGYFYGAELSPETLTRAMMQTRCDYGIALDMNAGHTGLEMYQAAPSGFLPDPGRKLHKTAEKDGAISGMPGWDFRARRLIRAMGLMNFPRYIQTEARDFFYLTLRHILPGPTLAGSSGWAVEGEYPYTVARAQVDIPHDGKPVTGKILKLDPRWLRAGSAARDGLVVHAGAEDSATVYHSSEQAPSFSILTKGAAPDGAVAVFHFSPMQGKQAARSAVGIGAEDGMLYYVELPGDDVLHASDLEKVLRDAGCANPVASFSRWAGAIDEPVALRTGAGLVRLSRGVGPGAKRVFSGTPVVSAEHWFPLQRGRVRYPRGSRASVGR